MLAAALACDSAISCKPAPEGSGSHPKQTNKTTQNKTKQNQTKPNQTKQNKIVVKLPGEVRGHLERWRDGWGRGQLCWYSINLHKG